MNDKVTMGKLAESLFVKLYGGKLSIDEFDCEKDLVLDGVNIEIKAQNRHPTKDLFTISDAYIKSGNVYGIENIIKCFNVDRLIFVEYDSTRFIKLWECPSPRSYVRYTTKAYKAMIGFPISQMILLNNYDNTELANKFRSLSQSGVYKR